MMSVLDFGEIVEHEDQLFTFWSFWSSILTLLTTPSHRQKARLNFAAWNGMQIAALT
jgi:hypothetical protein